MVYTLKTIWVSQWKKVMFDYTESKTFGEGIKLWMIDGSSETFNEFSFPVFILKHTRYVTNISGYWDLCVCVGVLYRIFLVENFHSRDKVGELVPSGESSHGNTVDSMLLLLFLSFPSGVLKEASVSKQKHSFSLDFGEVRDVKY